MKLYVIPLSHPCVAVRLMLQHKGIRHDTIEFLSGTHRLLLRLAGFRGGTVPALRVDGRRIQGSLAISRFLDEWKPEPPLFPRERGPRLEVEEAEAWGAGVLQDVPRRLTRWALVREPEVRRLLARQNGLPWPRLSALPMKPVAAYFARLSGASDEAVRGDLAELQALLDRVDRLVSDGVLDAAAPNAATFQIAPSVRLLMNFPQLEPLLRGRPGTRLALDLLPAYPGRMPRVFPEGWLP